MKKTKARAILRSQTVINFNGFQFEHLEYDETTTSLVGHNGAGKTTTMVAAYLPLMPDKDFLKFKNITDNTDQIRNDGNIYDRFGSYGDIGYSCMAFQLSDGSLLYAGVEVQKRPQRKYDLTPFTLQNVPHGIPPQDLLMTRNEDDHHVVSPLSELGSHFVSLGANYKKFNKLSDYFYVLYENGVLPTLMTTNSDRSKFHKLMMASFYGGLTGDLQKSIKDYLLPENNDIAAAVNRARELLDEARTSEREIVRAQEVYRRVQKVDRIAFDMVASAYFGIRNLYEARQAEVTDLRRQFRAKKVEYKQTLQQHEALLRELDYIKLLEGKKQQQRDAALEHKNKVAEAFRLAEQIDARRPELDEAMAVLEAAIATHEAAELTYQAINKEAEAFRRDVVTMATTLGEAQTAFVDISRKVGLFRYAEAALKKVQEAIVKGKGEIKPGDITVLLKAHNDLLARLRRHREPVHRQIQNAEDTRRTFTPIYQTVQSLYAGAQGALTEATAFCHAQQLLVDFRAKEQAVNDARDIVDKIRDASAKTQSQSVVKNLLARLASDGIRIDTAEQLMDKLTEVTDELRELNDAIDRDRGLIMEHTQAITRKEGDIREKQEVLQKWKAANQLVQQLVDLGSVYVASGEEMTLELRRVHDASSFQETVVRKLKYEIDSLSGHITDLHDNGSRLGEELGRLADKVGGRLVCDVYDDVDLKEAAKLEARMGPLIEAILVPNIKRAAGTLSLDADTTQGVWLVQDEQLPEVPEGEFVNEYCLTEFGHAARLTPVPVRPVLGRAAREAEIARLEIELAALRQEKVEAEDKLLVLRRRQQALLDLKQYAELLGTSSPQEVLHELTEEVQQAERNRTNAENRMRERSSQIDTAKERRRRLEECNKYAAFIGGEDYLETQRKLTAQRDQAAQYQHDIRKIAQPMHKIAQSLDILRTIPPSEAELTALRERLATLEEEISNTNQLVFLLTDVDRVKHDFGYEDQVELLLKKSGALEQMQKQYQKLSKTLLENEGARNRAEEALDGASQAKANANSECTSLRGWILTREQELAVKGVPFDATGMKLAEEDFEVADQALSEVHNQRETLARREGTLSGHKVTQFNQLAGSDGQTTLLSRTKAAIRQYARVSADLWQFHDVLNNDDQHLAERLTSNASASTYSRRAFSSLNDSLVDKRRDLLSALTEAHPDHIIDVLQATRSNLDYLRDWLKVRNFLERSLPRDITQHDDIQKALEDITHALEAMRLKQQEQESKFRTSAESISNSIANLVRREILHINRINNDRKLAEVHFGSITGIRIEASNNQRMAQFLSALRRTDDLFSQDRPLEEALALLYERELGGSANGAQLLDYRRYIDVRIQVRRLGQSQWDSNLGTSSGESIGVGAAILSVILDAMERQSEALHRRKVKGSIRFLMLDEANRLDSDSLEMMSSFCESMGVQLLVAAPEIAKARSGTIYTFVRKTTSQGQVVEVSYRGRRGFEVSREDA